MDNLTFYIAIGLGSIILLSVSFVYVKHTNIQWGGVSLAAIGMVLVGMPVWKTIDISINGDGFSAKLKQVKLEAREAKKEALLAKKLVEKTIDASLALKDSVEIFKTQQALKAKNLYTGTIDGELSTITRSAIMKFQASKGFQATGTIDTATLKALDLKPVHNFPAFEKSLNRVAGGFSPPAPTPPIMRIRNGRFEHYG